MRTIFTLLLALALAIAATAVQAQVAVWGLSLFHVDSGIWGPYLLITSLEAVIASAVLAAK